MFVSFLSASMPLVKRFELDPKTKTLIKHAYPNAYEFTSHEVDIPDLPAFAQAIAQHGAAGHCLLKGSISRPLISESRAGSTDANALTDWICLDWTGLSTQPQTASWLRSDSWTTRTWSSGLPAMGWIQQPLGCAATSTSSWTSPCTPGC